MTRRPWDPPAAGRESAGAAILGWLHDPRAPRLCVVSGLPGCGKSMLLAWLVEHATEPGTDAVRRVHGVVPLAGHSALTAAWQLAEQLQVSARTPGELLSWWHVIGDAQSSSCPTCMRALNPRRSKSWCAP